jgi:hypothetical protein
MWSEIHFALEQGWAWLRYTMADNPLYVAAVLVFIVALLLILRPDISSR